MRLPLYRQARALLKAYVDAQHVYSAETLRQPTVTGQAQALQTCLQQGAAGERWGAFDQSYAALLSAFRPVYEDLHRQRDDLYARLSSELTSEGVQIDHLRTYACAGLSFDPATVGCSMCGQPLNLLAEQLLAMPAAARLLRDEHQKELAKSTGAKRKVSRISVSTLLAGRQIAGEADLDQALQVVKDAARRALKDGNVVELI